MGGCRWVVVPLIILRPERFQGRSGEHYMNRISTFDFRAFHRAQKFRDGVPMAIWPDIVFKVCPESSDAPMRVVVGGGRRCVVVGAWS